MTGDRPSVPRPRPAWLAVAGYAALIAALMLATWAAVADILERRQAVEASADLLAQLEGRKPMRAGERGAPTGPVPSGSPFLEGQTLTVAGAALLQRVADSVTRAGGNVLSSQVDVQGAQAKDGHVSLIASCEIDYAALQPLLYDLEAGMPFLFVDQLVAQAPVASTAPEGGRMRVLLGLSGQWRRE